MKKTLMLATAVAMFAAPALAQTPGTGTQYSDHISTFQINAPVANFCKFGSVDNKATVKDGSTGANSYGNGADMGDQAFVVQIQNTADNTVKQATGSFNYAQAQCNTPFSVVTTSVNVGLKSEYQGAASAAFLKTVPYSISFTTGPFSAIGGAAKQPVAATNTLIASGTPFAGSATFSFEIPASSGLLLAGTYRDELRLTMSPLTGGASI